MIALLTLGLLGVLYKTKMLKYNLIVIALGLPFVFRVVGLQSKSDATTGDFRVASFNTLSLGRHTGINTSDQLERYLDSMDVHCAVLIEYPYSYGKISKKSFPHQVKIRSFPSAGSGILMVSKYPITDWGKVKFTELSYNMAGFMDIKRNGETLRIYGLHLETNRLKPGDYHELRSLEFDSAYNEKAKNVVGRLRRSMFKRSSQVSDIKQHTIACPHPFMILGDFNDTPQSYAYQQLKEGLDDAFVTSGKGFDATFLKPFPLLRIDYILYPKQYQAVNYQSTDELFSDHKLIFADLKTD